MTWVRASFRASIVFVLVACGINDVGDFPASAVVDGRTYLAAGAGFYEFDPADLAPHGMAEQVTVGGRDGNTVYEISGVDPREALVLPMLPGFDGEYHLLLPRETVQRGSVDDDFGIPGLCRYRPVDQGRCP